jgi:hypothetical protein
LQVAVDFAIAVGLTKEQVASGADLRSLSWLDSPAITTLLQPLNITAIPQALWSTINGSEAIDLKGLNLSSLFPYFAPAPLPGAPVAVPVPETPAAPATPGAPLLLPAADAAGAGAGVSKGIVAAIAVTVVIATLALAGVVWLLFAKGMICRQPATAASEGPGDSRPHRMRVRRRRGA